MRKTVRTAAASACTLLLFVASELQAQREVASQFHSWYNYFGNHRLNEHWGLHTEYQWRRENWGTTWQQSLARVGVDHFTRRGTQFTLGYGWIRSFPYGEQPISYPTDEHRIWEQVIRRHTLGETQWQQRFRLEQRSMETSEGRVWQHRVRYRLACKIPIQGSLFLAAYDEFFAHAGWRKDDLLLDQNRLSATVGWQLSTTADLQVGYLNQ